MEVWKKYQIVNRGMTFLPVLLPGQSYLSQTTVLSLQMMQPIVQLLKKMPAISEVERRE
jgi:hypothetical protein